MYLFIRKLQWRLPTIDNVNIWKIPYYLYPILAFKHPGKWYLQALSTSDVLNWFREHVTNSSKIDVRSMYAIYTLLWVYTFLYIFVYTFLWKDTQFSRIFTQRFYYINYLLSSHGSSSTKGDGALVHLYSLITFSQLLVLKVLMLKSGTFVDPNPNLGWAIRREELSIFHLFLFTKYLVSW